MLIIYHLHSANFMRVMTWNGIQRDYRYYLYTVDIIAFKNQRINPIRLIPTVKIICRDVDLVELARPRLFCSNGIPDFRSVIDRAEPSLLYLASAIFKVIFLLQKQFQKKNSESSIVFRNA